MVQSPQAYYVPAQSYWPIIGAIGLFGTLGGTALLLYSLQQEQASLLAQIMLFSGILILAGMLIGWFAAVIAESRKGLYSPQLDLSFRYSMSWFIFSEVMFFFAFFGALFYIRVFAVPWLGGEGDKGLANMLWPDFTAVWPLLEAPNTEQFRPIKAIIDPWHIPLLNTILLVASSFTLLAAHKFLKKGNRPKVKLWLGITIALGLSFLTLQIFEYFEAYNELDLTLESGIYGATFFLLTGFHGAHVTIGSIILMVLLLRVYQGHFTGEKHFAFEAGAWYWHFVDVVWILLFTTVYIL
ncbi:cytochrome c oxidase subunit 3 [Methylophaga thiooxydans]|uniref:cytochrome c oxidase subunit 3 n=1 Tax=Methylophaga thiooxydans TaxID=392484 RepID=UPI00235527F3|nr:cytochrome c oxidase subunit 3 [Methylophaga thiooxydans]